MFIGKKKKVKRFFQTELKKFTKKKKSTCSVCSEAKK